MSSRNDLRQAIEAHAFELGVADKDTELLSDFVVIASWVPIEANEHTHYTHHLHSDEVPMHVIIGMLELAKVDLLKREE